MTPESTPDAARSPQFGASACSRCSICERKFPSESLKEADDFDQQGNHRYLLICSECEADFDSANITFNFSANTSREAR
jgi:hypothetical protein